MCVRYIYNTRISKKRVRPTVVHPCWFKPKRGATMCIHLLYTYHIYITYICTNKGGSDGCAPTLAYAQKGCDDAY